MNEELDRNSFNAQDYNLVTMPISYSEADADMRAVLIERLDDIGRRAKEEAAPILEALARIDASYAPKMLLVRKEKP